MLDEIRPYLVGTGGGGLDNAGVDGPIVKVLPQLPLSGDTYMALAPRRDLLPLRTACKLDLFGKADILPAESSSINIQHAALIHVPCA